VLLTQGTEAQQRLTVSLVAADWHELMISTAHLSALLNNWTCGASLRHTTTPISWSSLHSKFWGRKRAEYNTLLN